jgi:hypothetical protein
LRWLNTLTPAEKSRYNHQLVEAVKSNQSIPSSEREKRTRLPERFSTERVSKEFNFSWASENEEERIVSYFEVYKLNAEQMRRFKSDMERRVARWAVSVRGDTEGEDQTQGDDGGEGDAMEDDEDEEDEEIYSSDRDATLRG